METAGSKLIVRNKSLGHNPALLQSGSHHDNLLSWDPVSQLQLGMPSGADRGLWVVTPWGMVQYMGTNVLSTLNMETELLRGPDSFLKIFIFEICLHHSS